MRKIHYIPDRAEAVGLIAQPAPGAFAILPDDDEPHTFKVHYNGRHKVPAKRQRHLVAAIGLGDQPSFRLACVDDLESFTGAVYNLPNVHSDARICWGGLRSPKTLLSFDTKFWASPFNSDLAGSTFPGWNARDVTVETLWRRHYGRLQQQPREIGIARTTLRWNRAEPGDDTPADDPRWTTQGRVISWGRGRSHRKRLYAGGRYARGMPCVDRIAAGGTSLYGYSRYFGDALQKMEDEAWGRWPGRNFHRYYRPDILDDEAMARWLSSDHTNAEDKAVWNGMTFDEQDALRDAVRAVKDAKEACIAVDRIVPDFLKNAKAVGIRLGQRDLPDDSRTKKQQETEDEVLYAVTRLAPHFPLTAKRLENYYAHLIEWHKATGKVRARRDELHAAFMAPYSTEEETRKREIRNANLSDYLSGRWRGYDDHGNPEGSAALTKVCDFEGYYLGPAAPAVFLTNEPNDLLELGEDYCLVPPGKAGACAGAWAAPHPDGGMALVFPHREKGLAAPMRARLSEEQITLAESAA